MSEPERENVAEYSVSELAVALKRTLEDGYGHVRVRGEISGFKRAASGHLYYVPEGREGGAGRGLLARHGQGASRCRPEDGLEVIASGRDHLLSRPLQATRSSSTSWSWPARAPC